jgi:membrane protein YdbS with pleckstrin-like domain
VSDSAFSNEPVDVSGLPQLAEQNFVPVHPNFLRVSLIGSAIFASIVLVAGVVVTALLPSNRWIPLCVMIVLLAFTALSAALKVVEVKNIAYQVREHDLSYRNGVLVKTVETVPFVRVQHARVAQGPVERAFGLATLAVNSAGPDLNIAGLGADDAERLRALVVERAGELVEES